MESQLAPLKEFLTEIIRPIVNSAVQEAMPKPEEKKRLRTYTVVEACEILKVSKPTLYDYFNFGLLKKYKNQGRTLIDADELEEGIKEERFVKYKRKK